MNWTELLHSEIEDTYRATEGLMNLVDDDKLDWAPESGVEWMSTRKLLRHLSDACGWCAANFVHDRWPQVMKGKAQDQPPTSVESVAEAKAELAKDKQRVLDAISAAGEEALASRMVQAPWEPVARPLGQQVLQMVNHLNLHKSQLFYYLKLQGKPVNTWTLYGLPQPPAE